MWLCNYMIVSLFTWPDSVGQGTGQQKPKFHVSPFFFNINQIPSFYDPIHLFICGTIPSQTPFLKVESNVPLTPSNY